MIQHDRSCSGSCLANPLSPHHIHISAKHIHICASLSFPSADQNGMPSIEARLKSANANADAASSRNDRKSADAVFLSASSLTPELSRVNSTPLSSDGIDALNLQPSASSSASASAQLADSPNEPSPLTVAPPKPSPADTLYPSPSGGFVPSPEEGQDWRLKPPPPGRNIQAAAAAAAAAAASSSAAVSAPSTASPQSASPRPLSSVAEGVIRPVSGISPAAASNTSTPTRPPSLPSSDHTAAKIASASSRRSSQASTSVASPQLRPASGSTSSHHRLSTASASLSPLAPSSADAAAAASLKGTDDAPHEPASPQHQPDSSARSSVQAHRPSSSASHHTAKAMDASAESVHSIKVRDFAFPVDDPRHFGVWLDEPEDSSHAHDADQSHQEDAAGHDFYIEGAEDENEFDGDDGDSASVPEGVYNVLYEFEPVSEHELAVQPGDVVHVVGSIEGGWAIAISSHDPSIKGLVPATYLEWSAPLPA